MRYLGNKGDTIVEVLIALVVVSTVMAGAFVSSNRSLINSRQAQERGEALKYVEGQLEQLKNNANQALMQTTPFCFASDRSLTTDLTRCKPGSIPGGYKLSISHDNTNNVFTVQAVWDNAAGTGTDQLKILYRINP